MFGVDSQGSGKTLHVVWLSKAQSCFLLGPVSSQAAPFSCSCVSHERSPLGSTSSINANVCELYWFISVLGLTRNGLEEFSAPQSWLWTDCVIHRPWEHEKVGGEEHVPWRKADQTGILRSQRAIIVLR